MRAFFLAILLLFPILPVHAQTDTILPNRIENPINESANHYEAPRLSVKIPTVSFSQSVFSNGRVDIPYIADYVAGLYRYLLSIAGLVATVLLMAYGLMYMLSSVGGKVEQAKTRMQNAFIGLVLLAAVHLLLSTVNPKLALLPHLALSTIPPLVTEVEDDVISGATVAASFDAPSGDNLTGAGLAQIPAELKTNLENAALSMKSSGFGMRVTSSLRSLQTQKNLIAENCQNPAGSATCNPKPGKPQTCILKDLNPANCPHTTGRALDIWGTRNGQQCVMQEICLKNLAACRADPCQSSVINALRGEGFCNLESEPWHFEKPKMSSKCN